MPEVCSACGAPLSTVSLQNPVDYEYGVQPRDSYYYLRCDSCSSEWLAPRPGDDALPAFYPDNYHAHNEDHGFVAGLLVSVRGWLRGRKYRSLLQGKAEGALFDVGAGDCRHFEELSRYADWTFAGVEIQEPVAAKAREEGFDIEQGTLESLDLERHRGRYDVVSMNHVLEHVSDPAEVVARCHLLLKPGGALIGQLPTNSSWETWFGGAWAGYHYPRHLQVFSRNGLKSILAGAGFGAISVKSAPHCQTAISMQNWLLAKGVNLKLEYGRSRVYGLLLLLSLPFEVLAWVLGQSGTVDFIARKPAA
jgi:SAM-dependent methyltransferase